MLTFNPGIPFFSDIHKLLVKHLPRGEGKTCLEIGCYPGTYLWYFNTYFGYRPSGIEYVEACVPKCREYMRSLGIEADIRQADLFQFSADEKWDLVYSVGLIEHFTDTTDVVKKHLELVKPGGYLVLIIPNHSGFHGKILKWVDEDKYNIHNRMGYKAMERAVSASGMAEIVEGGYYGHLGFWNNDLYPFLKSKGKIVYYPSAAVLRLIEYAAKYLVPDTAYFSPNSVLIARRKDQ